MAATPNREYADVIRNAQVILKRSKPDLKTDGYWGTFTNDAYANAPASDRMRVDAVLQAHGVSATFLFARSRRLKLSRDESYILGKAEARAERGQITMNANESAKSVSSDGWISVADMAGVLSRVSSATGIQTSVLQTFLELEQGAPKAKGYNAQIVNSLGYSGLFQFDRKGEAWAVASRIIALPPFNPNWKDPYYNTLAAAAYLLANTKTIRRLGYKGPVTGNIAYLMHNQGAGGAYKIISGQGVTAGKQSGAANKVIAMARQEASGYLA